MKTQKEHTIKNGQRLFEDRLFIRYKGMLHKVMFEDIIHIKSEGNSILIVSEEKQLVAKISLRKMMRKLPASMFIRIHNSYLVPVSRIQEVNFSEGRLSFKDINFPIGRSYKNSIMELMNLI